MRTICRSVSLSSRFIWSSKVLCSNFSKGCLRCSEYEFALSHRILLRRIAWFRINSNVLWSLSHGFLVYLHVNVCHFKIHKYTMHLCHELSLCLLFASMEFSSENLLAYITLVVELVDLGPSNNFNSNFPCQLLRNSSLVIKVRLFLLSVCGFDKQVNFIWQFS